jgi:hypothetical protein
VELAVGHLHGHVDHRVAGDDALGHLLADSLLDRGDELLGHRAADRVVLEDQARTARRGLDRQVDLGELTAAAGLLLVPVVALALARNRLAQGHARQSILTSTWCRSLTRRSAGLEVQ